MLNFDILATSYLSIARQMFQKTKLAHAYNIIYLLTVFSLSLELEMISLGVLTHYG